MGVRTEKKIREEELHRSQRSKLLGNESLKRRRKKDGPWSSNTASEAAVIQQSLNRTQDLLQNELQRVSQVASVINEDGKVLQETMNEQQTMNASTAKDALTNLDRAQQRERRYLMASVIFFWTVVVYIFWSRVFLHLPLVDTFLFSIKNLLKT